MDTPGKGAAPTPAEAEEPCEGKKTGQYQRTYILKMKESADHGQTLALPVIALQEG